MVGLLLPGLDEQVGADLVFCEQALLDDLGHVGAGELEAVGKAGLDFGEVVALLLAHVAQHGVHVFLGGDDDPGPALAFGGQAFGHRLQIGHELGVFGDVLADFVHKEVEAEVGRFLIQPGLDLVAEVFNGDAVLAAVFVQNAFGESWVFARDFRVGAGDVAALQQGLFTTTFPGLVGQTLVGVFEGGELVAAVQVAFKLGDIALLAKVAAHLIEDLDEHRQQGIDLVFADDVGLLVDVEQDALRWDGNGLFQGRAQQLIVSGNFG